MSSIIKVAWVHGPPSLPSTRIRNFQLRAPLEQSGLKISDTQYSTRHRQFVESISHLRQADVVILQKQLPPSDILKAIRANARRLIFDFDDAIYLRQSKKFGWKPSLKLAWRFRHVMKAADEVVAGNELLERAARRFGANTVHVLPSAVPADVPARETRDAFTEQAPLVLGWVGTSVNLPYLSAWAPLFHQLEVMGIPHRLRVVADKPVSIPNYSRVEFVPWSEEAQAAIIAGFDIGLMPMPDNLWTRGKCAYKALQYMAAGVPVLASDVGINRDWIGRAGQVVRNTDEGLSFIRTLLRQPELFKNLGDEGRRIVAERFSIESVSRQLADILLKAPSTG